LDNLTPLHRTQFESVIRCISMMCNTELSVSNIGDVGKFLDLAEWGEFKSDE
jgi:hypothetical protein